MTVTVQQKHELTEELKGLESSKTNVGARHLVRSVKAFLEKMRNTPRWEDSVSEIGASFRNMLSDTKEHRAYLRYVDITARARALLAFGAARLTPEEAELENLSTLNRAQGTEEFLSTTQRLSQPGGSIVETAYQTPEPLVEETIRRGAQVKEVGSKVVDVAAPVGQKAVDELESKGVLNPALGIIALAMIVFMKNKLLAVILILGLIYLTKQRQINEARQQVQKVTDKVSSIAERVDV
ncbi:MAG: hypothetical protein PVI43_06470 [Candidatus Bathyarchaeota archaeon]|jgi:hypothetical protein